MGIYLTQIYKSKGCILLSLQCVVNFSNLKHSTPYTVIISGDSAQHGSSSDFELEYSGADLIQRKGYIPKSVLPFLKDDLNDFLGYGPFDKKRLNREFNSLDQLVYLIERDSI